MTGPDPDLSREDLERAILGDTPDLTSEEVARTAEVPVADAHRLWRALGFPDPGDAAAFTHADVSALATVAGSVTGGVLDTDTVVRLTRAVGQTMAKLADWEVATLTGSMENSVRDGGNDNRMQLAMRLIEQVGPSFEVLLVYAWRRHLAAAMSRVEVLGSDDEDLHVVDVSVGFADLVSFTQLSNDLDEHQIGDLVEVFESRCQDVISARSGRVIKSLGDSVLFITDNATAAIDIALDILQVVGGDARLPDVRVGLATGSVVLRLGDVFGPPVNLAARLTAVARRNRVITDQRTAALLPVDEFATQPLPARVLRGFGEVEPIAVRRTRSRHA